MKSVLRVATHAGGVLAILVAVAAPAFAAPPGDAPEIDPGSFISALTLFAGGAILMVDRYRRK